MRRLKINLLAVAVLLGLAQFTRLHAAQSPREPIGTFSNQEFSEESGDCGGYTIWLWKAGKSIEGEMSAFEGRCVADKKTLYDVRLDPVTSKVEFKCQLWNDAKPQSFVGRIKGDALIGVMELDGGREQVFKRKPW